jgi:uncharacterized protein YoxC
VSDPIFWLGLSIFLVAFSITVMLIVAIPAFQELGRASRSAEKLFEMLHRELPPTLDAIRRTGSEISDLTGDLSQGVQSAGQIVKQVDDGMTNVKQQVQRAQVGGRSLMAGMKAAWRSFSQPPRLAPPSSKGSRRGLPPSSRGSLSELRRYAHEEYREDLHLVYEEYEVYDDDPANGSTSEMREPPPQSENRQPAQRDLEY